MHVLVLGLLCCDLSLGTVKCSQLFYGSGRLGQTTNQLESPCSILSIGYI